MGYGLYIHVPFCVTKCMYCDFLSFPVEHVESYVAALLAEMDTARSTLSNTPIDTVYIGGGTPTAMPTPFLCEILQAVAGFSLTEDVEITVEANPGTLGSLAIFRENGVNRLSIGLQAWQDRFLKALGRAHRLTEFNMMFEEACAAGFDNINVDVMFSLPGQTLDDWCETLTGVISLRPTHISAYSLTPAEDTPLWDEINGGRIVLPNDDTDRDMYHRGNQLLTAAGYNHYELSNYALPGCESRHNVNCWKRKPYLGLGLGASSFDGATRWKNTSDLKQYINASGLLPREEITPLTNEDAMAETMFLGLRMTQGVSESDFKAQFGVTLTDIYGSQISQLVTDGLLHIKKGYIGLTPRGRDLANHVFMMFV